MSSIHLLLDKMNTEYLSPVRYYQSSDTGIDFEWNHLINNNIVITSIDTECLCCHTKQKLFRQGFCYKCFYQSPKAGEWVFFPEKSTSHLGIEDRELGYEAKQQLQDHIVYLALSPELKVGVTRSTHYLTRWIDQGANKAIILAKFPNRYLAGLAEIMIKKQVSDKTQWRKMLSSTVSNIDLIEEKNKIIEYLDESLKSYITVNETIIPIKYPISYFPQKINSVNLDKSPKIIGKLIGLKGQYLIFEDGQVFNVRAHGGYHIGLEF